MPECIKCGHIFKGLGIMGTPWQNEKTGQWICRNCWGKFYAVWDEAEGLIAYFTRPIMEETPNKGKP